MSSKFPTSRRNRLISPSNRRISSVTVESARRTGNYPTCMRNLDGPERGHRSVR